MLRYQGMDLEKLSEVFPDTLRRFSAKREIAQRLKIEAVYELIVSQQQREIAEVRRDESLALPEDIDYLNLTAALSQEVREKLSQSRPETIGAAGRIPGVTPAAVVNLLRYVKRGAQAPHAHGRAVLAPGARGDPPLGNRSSEQSVL
ncbi:hypothetical protein FKM82_002713 [Ascaphus truei]